MLLFCTTICMKFKNLIGARQTSIESTIAILNKRFSDADMDTLTPALEAIRDLNRLKQLNLEASVVESFRAFQEHLDA